MSIIRYFESAPGRCQYSHAAVSAERDLADLIRRPFDLYEPGAVDEYILGQLNQPAMAMDFAITEEVRPR